MGAAAAPRTFASPTRGVRFTPEENEQIERALDHLWHRNGGRRPTFSVVARDVVLNHVRDVLANHDTQSSEAV